jgi:hypothetical protein
MMVLWGRGVKQEVLTFRDTCWNIYKWNTVFEKRSKVFELYYKVIRRREKKVGSMLKIIKPDDKFVTLIFLFSLLLTWSKYL